MSEPAKGLVGLRLIRTAIGISQAQFAKIAGCSTVTVRHVESGWRDCGQSVQRRIAEGIGCEVMDLHNPALSDKRLHEIASQYHALRAQSHAHKAGVA